MTDQQSKLTTVNNQKQHIYSDWLKTYNRKWLVDKIPNQESSL